MQFVKKKVAVAMSGPVKSRLSSGSRGKRSGKVAVAMSGGVDSGVAAALLVKAGYKCAGFHMRLWSEPASSVKRLASSFENKCCSTESLEAARKTCHKLGIPFYTIDFSKIFKKKIVDYFLSKYAAGLTPNPCVMCNKYIKFGQLLDYVRKLGFDYLATGHYARIVRGAEVAHRNFDSASDSLAKNRPLSNESFRRSQGEVSQNLWAPRAPLYRLLTGVDKFKDQSYFLYNFTQEQLAHVLFPVGDYSKKQVKVMAEKWNLPVARRPESQEICFLPETDYRPFLRRQISKKIIPGEVVDTEGRVIGRHYGLPLYTIGQRHGFKIVDGKYEVRSGIIPPFYVIGKDGKKNRLIVGFGKEAERKEFWVKNVNWIDPNFQFSIFNFQLFVRIRHQGELLKCRIKNVKLKMTKVVLDEPERGIASGQAAVFYKKCKIKNLKLKIDDYEVLGGGIIAIDKN